MGRSATVNLVHFTTVYHAINNNAQASELLNAPEVVTREEVNWKYWLPMSLGLTHTGNLLQVNWQGGALQHSTNLGQWIEVTNATQPYHHAITAGGADFWRLRK